jgi:hypothetical protein
VTRPLAAVRDFFVVPARDAGRAAGGPPPAARASFAVLGDRGDAVAVASGLALARAAGAGLVCVWPPGDHGPRLPATNRARRLAARLDARGLAAVAGGRLVRVSLPAPGAQAVATAQRAVAAVDVPAAVVLAGPREDEFDALLTLQDAVVLVPREPVESCLVRLAVSGLAEVAGPVVTVSPPSGPVRALATAGLVAPPALRSALAPALVALAR